MARKVEILEIGETETVGTNGFEVRPVLVKTVERFPQELETQLQQGHVVLGDEIEVGKEYMMEYNLKGSKSEKNGKTLRFVKICPWQFKPAE